MLEQMRKAGFAVRLVGRADVIPHGDVHNGRLVVLVYDDSQTVVELEALICEIDRIDLRRRGRCVGERGRAGQRACERGELQAGLECAHGGSL